MPRCSWERRRNGQIYKLGARPFLSYGQIEDAECHLSGHFANGQLSSAIFSSDSWKSDAEQVEHQTRGSKLGTDGRFGQGLLEWCQTDTSEWSLCICALWSLTKAAIPVACEARSTVGPKLEANALAGDHVRDKSGEVQQEACHAGTEGGGDQLASPLCSS